MAKTKTTYVCQSCGYETLQWLGRCTQCQAWNSFVEEKTVTAVKAPRAAVTIQTKPIALNDVQPEQAMRLPTNITEFDRVLGGGFCLSSITLLGGDPGIGKSTISLQLAQSLGEQAIPVLYVTGEESLQQLKLRADRLKVNAESIALFAVTNILDIENALNGMRFVIIDSIQTMYHPDLPSAPGSVGQVRESAAYLIRKAKELGVTMLFIGHVTKEGSLAGPKVLEHMVDTVLYFEGDQNQQFRLVRSIKNRFGAAHELGIFDMQAQGLIEVQNPSSHFMQLHREPMPGSSIVGMLEGTRTFLVEVQALTTNSYLTMPRRTVTGITTNRADIIIAVLEKKCGLHIGRHDVFVNVVGGVSINDPGADLGLAIAIASSFKDIATQPHTCFIGEIGLGGEVRQVQHLERRIQEAAKLGFKQCVIPFGSKLNLETSVEIISVKTVAEALAKAL